MIPKWCIKIQVNTFSRVKVWCYMQNFLNLKWTIILSKSKLELWALDSDLLSCSQISVWSYKQISWVVDEICCCMQNFNQCYAKAGLNWIEEQSMVSLGLCHQSKPCMKYTQMCCLIVLLTASFLLFDS
jgi:hypothetical protein